MMKKAIELALKTWYPEDHDLHLNPHYPLGKLTGEWGELLDDYMKMLYKPDYEWSFIDEMGDVWYYVRILAYQQNHSLEHEENMIYSIDIENQNIAFSTSDIDTIISISIYISIKTKLTNKIDSKFFNVNYSILWELCNRFGLDLEQLTMFNQHKFRRLAET